MKDLFEKGVSFRTFILNQSPENRGRFMKYYIPMDIRQDFRDRIAAVSHKVNILGVVEGWCPDCHINLSVLEKLISTNSNICLKLITKADAENELAEHLEDGDLKIPTVIFMNEVYQEKASFTQRPEIMKSIDINTVEGERLYRDYEAGKFIGDTALQLLEKIEQTV